MSRRNLPVIELDDHQINCFPASMWEEFARIGVDPGEVRRYWLDYQCDTASTGGKVGWAEFLYYVEFAQKEAGIFNVAEV